MSSFLSVALIFIAYKLLDLFLRPFIYLLNIFSKSNAKNEVQKNRRFDFFDLNRTDDMHKMGILSNQEQWNFESPNQSKREVVSLFGVNSWGQLLKLEIDWRPQSINTCYIRVGFTFEDGKGNTYSIDETNLIATDSTKHEYKAPGISLEILSPFRRLRIKFRGFLNKKGTNQLVFAKMRVLWFAISNIFDFQCDHNQIFIEKQLTKSKKLRKFDQVHFEDRFEQLGQMKGTVQFEGQEEEKLFLWGNKSKKYEEPDENRKIYRLFGYSKKGWVFHIGSVVDKNRDVIYSYGFGFSAKTQIFPIESLSDIELSSLSQTKQIKFSLSFGGKDVNVWLKNLISENVFHIEINGIEGRALFSLQNESQMKADRMRSPQIIEDELYFPFISETKELVLPLNDRKSENVLISGGKGSSLASLNYFRQKYKNSLNVEIPKGVIVTCNSYKLMLDHNKHIQTCIHNMKRVVSEIDSLKKESLNVIKSFEGSQLPQEIKDEILFNLNQLFGESDVCNKSFAVRSSASGEDSEEMSAAGQMTTHLGVKGMDAIYSAVIKCWSSQFEFVAIEYKRGYGQDLNSMMAVVIQEMVDCDSAGVLFTCDPVSGSDRELIITANYGIGESVVSAMAEPDTIRVEVNIKDNSFRDRTVGAIKSISIGSKSKSIKMNESGDGTVHFENTDPNKCCLSPDIIGRLSAIALEIQNFFGSVRDIEWGIKEDQIFILQSRPVTNLDSGFTEFELMHEFDGGLPSEKEYLSKANVGEVLPGCSSLIGSEFMMKLWTPLILKDANQTLGLPLDVFCPFPSMEFGKVCQHCFLSLKNSEMLKLSNESNYTKAWILSIFGHELDPEIIEDCKEIRESDPWTVEMKKNVNILPYMLVPDYFINKFHQNVHKMTNIFDGKFDTISEMFDNIMKRVYPLYEECLTHIKATEASSMWNYVLITILSEDKNNPNIFFDFAFLLSECGELVSADVPSALKQLARTIEEPKLFRELSDEKALQYLKSNEKSSLKLKEFLEKHGHRGYKEFDPMTRPWRDDPTPVIKSIKTMLSGNASLFKEKPKRSIAEIIDSLKTPLSYPRKQLLKHVFLPLARRGVAMRETTKSLTVFSFDILRKGFWKLAHRMHSEGLIPEVDLFFQMSAEEIEIFIESRNPLFVWKARQRKRLYNKMNNWKFDEIISGYDFMPRELMQQNLPKIMGNEIIKGTPVSVGKIVAKVCVAPNLEDALNIQPGDILVTYSTDIGWSPYFPMISGIVTEIGGLVSHGAVIAREYGLPCLVGAEGATHLLKTGDMVLLDTQKGIITRVDTNNNDIQSD